MSDRIDISTLAGNAVVERFGDEFQKTLENIADRNTDWKKKRKLTIEVVTYARSEQRDDVAVDISVKNSIAPYMPIATQLYIGTDNKGNVVAEEYNKDAIKGQLKFDKETGEVQSPKVFNMRGAK